MIFVKMHTALAALALAVLCATAAHATPSTLIWIPSTDIQANKVWHLGIDNYSVPSGGSLPTDYGITYGLLDGRAEVGVDYFGGAEHPLYFNAKYLLLPENKKQPAIAVGLMNFGTESDVTDYDMAYAVLAKTFDGVRLTAGYCHGNADALGSDPNMLLLGVDGYLTKNKKWWGGIDFQSGKNTFGALNAGVAYSFTDNISVILGYDIYNNSAFDNTITTQVDINF